VSALSFTVTGSRPEPFAASPQLALRVRVEETTGVPIYAITLRAQVRIEPQARTYDDDDAERLVELFGGRERYGDTLRSMLWTHVSQTVVAFEGATDFDLAIPCSYDFEVAAHKYLAALREGFIPIVLMFSGTVFVRDGNGVASELIPWSCEARYPLPVAVWRATMDAHFPNTAWIRIDRDTFDELQRFKIAGAFPTWEAAFARLTTYAKSER
jgi:hypothetical protein